MEGLFALGSNGSGQLGIGHREDVSVPKQARLEPPPSTGNGIVKIAAGGNHTILVTASGRAYWSGDPSTGACGVVVAAAPPLLPPPVFCEVVLSKTGPGPGPGPEHPEPLGPVAHVACTWDASVFVLRDAEDRATRVYTCGGGGGRGVGDGDGGGEPGLMADFPPAGSEVRDLAAGLRHVVAVLDNGDAYGWGSGRRGQLGVLDEDDGGGGGGVARRPLRIQGVGFPAARAVCCQHATCLVAGPGDGRIRVLGADRWALRSSAPPAVPNWKAITASWGGFYVLRYDGTLEAWGRDDHGQLPPPGIPRITDVAAGSEHVVALTDEGEVVAWGWGEHGNCGPQTGESGDVKGRWNVIASLKNLPEGTEITAIGAGCATSWINIVADGIFL